jgi:putative ABC transport system permease protein
MLKNYLLISFRNLRKHFSYSLINIFGLGLGLGICLLLVTWITHELSYDKFHAKAGKTYRASLEYSFGGQIARTAVSPTALLPALETLPEVETVVRVCNPSAWNPFIVKLGEKLFHERRFYVADSTFFKVFSYELIKGDENTALSQPYSVLITESAVKKYFGADDPIGKTIFVNNSNDYTITGVLKDPPSNSLMKFDFIGSFSSIRAGREQPSWWSANYQTYFVLQPGANVEHVYEKLDRIVKAEVGGNLPGTSDYVRYNFIPLTDIYLHSDFDGEPEVVGDIKHVYIFSGIALLILVIACINYINLATARAADRAKEVGIRKVVGALQKQLFTQFIGESVIITFLAFCFGFFLAEIFLPLFNELTGKGFHYGILLAPKILTASLAALILIALVSGAYPAFAITSFKPVSVLKGNFKTSGRGVWLRKSLVVFQFAISVILITGTIIIVKQLQFIQDRKLGYNKENTIVLPLDSKTSENYEAFKTELLRSGSASHVTRATESPINIKAGYSINTSASPDQAMIVTGLLVDEDYLPAMGMELIAGRNFTREDRVRITTDTVYSYILNESAVKALFLDVDKAVGTKVGMGDSRRGEIIGVVSDFHFASLHKNINPLVIFPEERQFNKVFIKLPAGNVNESLDKIGKIYSSLLSHRPFEYQFLDQQFEALYTNEQRIGSVFVVFATLAIIIACLGLLGLVSFTASQKTKEIGIRKVLGAKASNIVVLITKDFTQLVIIAILIGLPLAYWMMGQWLSDFAYRTEMGIWPVIIASVLCILIAIGTAGYQAIKAALLDPAKTLRSE